MPMTAPPPPATAAKVGVERAIVRRINRVRRAHGLRAVKLSVHLTQLARAHSRDMLRRDALTHSASSGASLSARLSSAGRRRAYGEVLAWAPRGSRTGARRIVALWMHSPSHRQVLLDGALRRIGVGHVAGAMGRVHGHAVTADFSS